MARQIDEIIKDFEALRMSDFDVCNVVSRGTERLKALTDELLQTPNPEQAIEAMFKVFERLPDADLDAPGPLILLHTIEDIGNYKERLIESVRRQPTPSTVWMVNRILNKPQTKERRKFLLSLLEDTLVHPLASVKTKQEAQNFLDWQLSERRANLDVPHNYKFPEEEGIILETGRKIRINGFYLYRTYGGVLAGDPVEVSYDIKERLKEKIHEQFPIFEPLYIYDEGTPVLPAYTCIADLSSEPIKSDYHLSFLYICWFTSSLHPSVLSIVKSILQKIDWELLAKDAHY